MGATQRNHRATIISQIDESGCSSPAFVPQTVMKKVRRLILVLSAFIGVWVLVSFGGAMIDSANAGFWSSSLMWSLLSSLIIMPALVVANHASTKAEQKKTAKQTKTSAQKRDEEPFIEEHSEEPHEPHTLWPEPEQEADWPAEETVREQERTRV